MAKNNLLQNFAKFTISESASDTLKGGRSNNNIPINSGGSYGFINWDDVGVRNPNIVAAPGISFLSPRKFKKG
ncbi:MAG: hypothetical protein AAFZ15_05970 [Bacteroidota bacterium]